MFAFSHFYHGRCIFRCEKLAGKFQFPGNDSLIGKIFFPNAKGEQSREAERTAAKLPIQNKCTRWYKQTEDLTNRKIRDSWFSLCQRFGNTQAKPTHRTWVKLNTLITLIRSVISSPLVCNIFQVRPTDKNTQRRIKWNPLEIPAVILRSYSRSLVSGIS